MGFEARERLMRRPEDIAVGERPHATRLARLSYRAPDIVESILDGRQPTGLTPRRLLREAQLPLCWQAQRQQLGPAARS
jgi:site-specific DNA recombinase